MLKKRHECDKLNLKCTWKAFNFHNRIKCKTYEKFPKQKNLNKNQQQQWPIQCHLQLLSLIFMHFLTQHICGRAHDHLNDEGRCFLLLQQHDNKWNGTNFFRTHKCRHLQNIFLLIWWLNHHHVAWLFGKCLFAININENFTIWVLSPEDLLCHLDFIVRVDKKMKKISLLLTLNS